MLINVGKTQIYYKCDFLNYFWVAKTTCYVIRKNGCL